MSLECLQPLGPLRVKPNPLWSLFHHTFCSITIDNGPSRYYH